MGRIGTEDNRLGLCPPTPLGPLGAEVPVPDVRPQRGVRIAHALDDVLRGLRAEPTGLEFAVTQLPQWRFPALEPELPERDGRYPVRRLVDRA